MAGENGTGKADLTWVWVTLAAVVIMGFFVFHQSIAPVKNPTIELVPKGTQAAYNPMTLPQYQQPQYQQPYYPPYDPNSGDMAYYNAQSTQALAEAAQNAAYAQQAGSFLENLTNNVFGTAD
jgi:hypothetical protein